MIERAAVLERDRRRRDGAERVGTIWSQCVVRFIGEDSLLMREGLVRLLGEHDFEVVGQAADAETLLRRTRALKPDVAIVDIRMPPTCTNEGVRAAEEIHSGEPGTGVLVLPQYVELHYATRLLESAAGGVGYLLEDWTSSGRGGWRREDPSSTPSSSRRCSRRDDRRIRSTS